MKLAEALMLRADLQKALASLRERAQNNALVQQGDKPSEDPALLLRDSKEGPGSRGWVTRQDTAGGEMAVRSHS